MHYLATLSNKLVAAYHNQESVLNPKKHSIDKVDTRLLAEALQAVLEQEIESGRLQCDPSHPQHREAYLLEQHEPFFAEILFHRG